MNSDLKASLHELYITGAKVSALSFFFFLLDGGSGHEPGLPEGSVLAVLQGIFIPLSEA